MMNKQQHSQELQILSIEHNRTIDTLHSLINTLEEEYEMAAQTLSNRQQYVPKYVVNLGIKCQQLGLVHGLINNIQAAARMVNILQHNHLDNPSSRLSIYLVEQQSRLPTINQKQKNKQFSIEQYIQKYRNSTQLILEKPMLKKQILVKIKQKCKNIFTIKLLSSQFEENKEIEDIDVIQLNIFQNISVLDFKQNVITDAAIQIIRDNMKNVKQINLSKCYMITQRGINILSECNFVTIIMNSMNFINENNIIQLIKNSHNLNYLQIKQCPNLSSTMFLRVYQTYKTHHSSLKWLQLISDYGIDLYINKLTYLTSSNPIEQITDAELNTLIGEHSPNYTGIFFENCQELSRSSLQLIIKKFRDLKRLALSKFINLTDKLVQDLCLSLIQLVFLDLNCCLNITNSSLYYIATNLKIQYLILERCLSITDEGLSYIFKQNMDQTITISNSQKAKKSNSVPKRKKPFVRLSSQQSPNQFFEPSTNQQNKKKSRLSLNYLNIAYCKKITDESLVLMCSIAHDLKYLNLSNCDHITNVSIENISKGLQNLEYLNLNHCEGLTDSSISLLATRLGRKLKVLQLEWCQISQNCVRLIAENLTHLQVLNISYCPAVMSQQIELIAQNMQKMHTIKLQSCSKIKQQAFIKLASLKYLTIVCIKQCVDATDIFIKLLATNNKYLQYLDISWCTQITDKGLFSIVKYCYNLKHLNLNGCVEITDEGIQWLSTTVSQIEYLNLTLCSKLTDLAVMEITTKMKSLKNLYLCELQLLTDISISTISNLGKLEQLILMGCKGITNSSLIGLMYNLAKLNELNISQCRSVEGKQLDKICQFMHNIKILQISEIQINDQFLDELATHCQKLTFINLCYCNQISDEAVLKMLQRIPRLEKIDIQNTNITMKTKGLLAHALNARKMANIILK